MKVLLAAMLLSGMLAGCTSNRQTTNNNMEQELDLTQEWDKVFPLSEPFSSSLRKFKDSSPKYSLVGL